MWITTFGSRHHSPGLLNDICKFLEEVLRYLNSCFSFDFLNNLTQRNKQTKLHSLNKLFICLNTSIKKNLLYVNLEKTGEISLAVMTRGFSGKKNGKEILLELELHYSMCVGFIVIQAKKN